MAKKSDKLSGKPKKPIIKKRRVAPAPVPTPDDVYVPEDEKIVFDDQGSEQTGGTYEIGVEDLPDAEHLDLADINGRSLADTITAPGKSVFSDGKGYDKKYDGTFNEFTDGVMFNPSEPPMGFDSEWVRFLNQLSADETTKSLADYIRIAPLTRRAKYKLMIYIKTLLDREFTMSNIVDLHDMTSLNLDKLLIDADLTLGLTRFDLSPEFQHVINLVRIKFGIKSRRSLYGFERINVNTQRSVNANEESGGRSGGMEIRKSIQKRVSDLFNGGGD